MEYTPGISYDKISTMIRFFHGIVYVKYGYQLSLAAIVLLLSCSLFAQSNPFSNTLKHKLSEAKSDSSRVRILNKLAYDLAYSNPDSALVYAREAERLAKASNLKKHLPKTNRILGDLLSDAGKYQQAYAYYIEGLQLCRQYNWKQEEAQLLNNLALLYDGEGDSLKTVETFQQSLNIKEALDDEKGIIVSHINLGDFYNRRGNITKALAHFNQCVGRAEAIGDTILLIESYNTIGVTHQNQYNTQEAIDNFQKAFRLAGAIGNTHYIANVSTNFGKLYLTMKEYDLALDFYQKALQWFQKANYPAGIAAAYINIGGTYLETTDYEKALTHYELGLPIVERLDSKRLKLGAYSGLGRIYEEKDADYTTSLSYYKKWYAIADTLSIARERADAAIYIGKNYNKLNDFEKGLTWCKKAGSMTENYLDLAQERCICLSNSFEGLGNYKEALACHVRFKELTDSIHQIDYAEEIMELTAQQKVELELSEEENQRKIGEKQLEVDMERARTRNILIIGLITALSLLTITFIMRTNSKKIAQKNKELAHSNRIKEQFIASVSHQVRTPMNSIMGFTEMLLDSVPTPYKAPLQDIKFAGSHLMKLLTATLDLSQLEQSKVILERKEFDLEASMQRLYAAQKANNGNAAVDFHFTFFNHKLSHKVLGDEERLHQILSCLLDNAIKFTKEGEVEFKVEVQKFTNASARVYFEVKDTGCGISEEKLPFIFDSFSEIADVKEQQFAGSGLGLSIAKRLLDLHDSELIVDSSLNEGSSFAFYLELPLGTALDEALVITKEFFGKKVLIVEDNLLNQKLVQKALESKGVMVTTAGNGLLGLEAIQIDDFDVVLMDLNMPVMDGFEATRRIRQLQAPKGNTPIVVLTALDDNAKAAIEPLGISGYMRKPFKAEDLYNSIYQAIKMPFNAVFS